MTTTAVDRLAAVATVNPLAWAKLHIPAMVPAPFAPFHPKLVAWPEPGEWQARVVFRGAAKSTLTKATVVHACEHGRGRGVLVIRAIGADAKADREALKRLAEMRGLHVQVDGDRGLVLINGVPVWTRTPGGAVRGLHYVRTDGAVIRPDTIIIDDLETRETAASKYQTDRLETWLLSDALQTAGRGEENAARVIMLGTPISPITLIAKAMRREAPFDTWLEPVVIPYVDPATGVPAWPDLYEPELEGKIPAITWASEYILNPLPPGTLVFDPTLTRWADPPDGMMLAVAVDPAGEGEDRTAIAAVALTPDHGLFVHDVALYDGPAQNMPEAVGQAVRRWTSEGHRIIGVNVEAVGGFTYAVPRIRQQVAPASVVAETPHVSKLERALPLTLWHQAGCFTWNNALRGSDADVETHTWTLKGHTVTGHDDAPDAITWAAGLATRGWSIPVPV